MNESRFATSTRRRARLTLLGGLLVAFSLLAAAGWFRVWKDRSERRSRAVALFHSALGCESLTRPYDADLRESFGVPEILTSRSEAVKHLFLAAAMLDPLAQTEAEMLLGEFVIPENCALGVEYLRRAAARGRKSRVLEQVDEIGCALYLQQIHDLQLKRMEGGVLPDNHEVRSELAAMMRQVQALEADWGAGREEKPPEPRESGRADPGSGGRAK